MPPSSGEFARRAGEFPGPSYGSGRSVGRHVASWHVIEDNDYCWWGRVVSGDLISPDWLDLGLIEGRLIRRVRI